MCTVVSLHTYYVDARQGDRKLTVVHNYGHGAHGKLKNVSLLGPTDSFD